MERYRLTDGSVVKKNAVNRHHVMHYARWYQTPTERLFRNIEGLVLPLYVPEHNELHANVPPPLKPTRPLMEQVTEYAHELYDDPYEQFNKLVHFIGDIANSSWSCERADEAFRLHENLIAQAGYIELGRVEHLGAV